jgi:mannosyltransferase OCH1-like enzyme
MTNIPKIVHYCWFGGQPHNALIQNCIESWKVHLPEYEIIEWNEENSILDCEFARKALELKKWAFLSDYIRLKALLEHGGVYLDTDMFFVKPLGTLMDSSCFIGKQYDGQIAAGIIGAVPKHAFIKYCLEQYQTMHFDENRLMNMAIPKILTEAYHAYPEQSEVHILHYLYFYPYLFEDSLKGLDFRTSIVQQTIAVHLWNASWFTEKELAGFALEKKEYLKAALLMLRYAFKNPAFLMQLPKVALRYLSGKRKDEE